MGSGVYCRELSMVEEKSRFASAIGGPDDYRPAGFYQTHQFRNPEQWAAYVRDNPVLGSFVSLSDMELKRSGSPWVSQFVSNLREFVGEYIRKTHGPNLDKLVYLRLRKQLYQQILHGEPTPKL